ncbi:ABC-type branched-chain amino acid transport system, ATPase component [Izhakiella capsodis]|uniref:ABC-type branched-chain amino acid transport system, ATPase component n=1 Tax=Izhakiella capsodis TaxID=1367852 RepID=A0A1I4UG25_9GAMM|nr:ATP-binding cassette domain-containing protein [Izhakiella capsodis]SFM87801.1 ABC-type branched-chain amino acid transport system, ATPase component [Izhakiella capsodis]
MLSVRSVNQFYGKQPVLRDIDLDLLPGTCTAIIGRSGTGKTTLVNCIMGRLPINSGSITWHQAGSPPANLLNQPGETRAAMGIGCLSQRSQIFTQMTVEENLLIALLAGVQQRTIPPMLYQLFPVLFSLRHQRSGQLPADLQRQLALARALVPQPQLLILDDPTGGMSPRREEEMVTLIHRLNHDFGLTILLLQQRLSLIQRVADHFLLLHVAYGQHIAHGMNQGNLRKPLRSCESGSG